MYQESSPTLDLLLCDEKDSQRAINAEKQSRTAGLRELPMLRMFWPMSIALKSTSILR